MQSNTNELPAAKRGEFLDALRSALNEVPHAPTAVMLVNPDRFAMVNVICGVPTAEGMLGSIVRILRESAPGALVALYNSAEYAVLLTGDLALQRETVTERAHAAVTELLRPLESAAMRQLALDAASLHREALPYSDSRPVLSVSAVTMNCPASLRMPPREVMNSLGQRMLEAKRDGGGRFLVVA